MRWKILSVFKYVFYFLIVFIVMGNFLVTVFYRIDWKKEAVKNEKIFKYKIVNYENVGDTKHILFFTQLWSRRNWGLSNVTLTKNSPELSNCPYKNCIFTSNRTYLNQTHEYDALIFHQCPSVWHNKSLIHPIKTRSPHQLYIFAAQE